MSNQWDVFISYARGDRDYAHRLCEALRTHGLNVWWDWDLVGGEDFRGRIRDVIGATSRVIVLWSEQSIASHFVIDEASEAKRQGKLIPLSIDGSEPPFGFGGLHTVVIRSIDEDLEMIVASIQRKASPRPPSGQLIGHGGFGGKNPSLTRRGVLAGGAAVAAAGAAGAAYRFWPQPAAEVLAPSPSASPEAASAGPPDFSNLRRTALVIGNSAYVNVPKLYNPKGDAQKVVSALEEKGFSVIPRFDLTAEDMREAFATFETALSVSGGVGLFYYAGNAAHIDGIDILLPIDTGFDKETQEIVGGINLTELQHKIRSLTSKKFRDNGSATIYSASKGERAADGVPGANSPFAKAFLDAIARSDGELGDVFTEICVAMEPTDAIGEQATRGIQKLRATKQLPEKFTQTPVMERALTKNFYFNRPRHDADIGVMKILVLDSCRDNPFEAQVATR